MTSREEAINIADRWVTKGGYVNESEKSRLVAYLLDIVIALEDKINDSKEKL